MPRSFFDVSARASTVARELRGGAVTFAAMSYIVFVQPAILSRHAEQAGLMEDGRLPRGERAMLSDAAGTMVGAALGTSTVSSYIESASGVAEGARTGLANVATAALFLAAIFFSPLAALVLAAYALLPRLRH